MWCMKDKRKLKAKPTATHQKNKNFGVCWKNVTDRPLAQPLGRTAEKTLATHPQQKEIVPMPNFPLQHAPLTRLLHHPHVGRRGCPLIVLDFYTTGQEEREYD